MDSCELKCWENCHGSPLTLGLKVKVMDESNYYADFQGGEFYITSIAFDSEGVTIGINDGKPDDFQTAWEGFRINELTVVN